MGPLAEPTGGHRPLASQRVRPVGSLRHANKHLT